MGREWKCICKDCDVSFTYSDTKYQAGLVRGHSRPERCDNCRAHHSRELQAIGQPYYVVRALKPIGDPRRLTSDLGRFNRDDRPHEAVDTRPPPIDPNKFGIKDDRLVEMFHFFKQDPGLQVVVVVGPTGSGKSTYFPYRLVELPESFQDAQGNRQDCYWTVPIETDADLHQAQAWVKEQAKLKGTGEHTIYVKGHHRHYASKPNDPRAVEHKVSGAGGLDPKMFWRYGQIVITQPRIQATRNIPDFIAKAMMGCRLGAGHDIGFRHSGSPNSDWNTKLAFVTDGTLITWLAKGELDKINTIMIDEAHERSLNIDIIIGMLTQLLPRYPRLRLIIASATIAADKFINHFNKHLPQRKDAQGNILPNCRYMEFEGKSFKVTPHFLRPVETPLEYYREALPSGTWEGRHRQPKELSELVAKKAMEILKAMYDPSPEGGYLTDHDGNKIDITERQGDVLGFLHGEKPIEECCATVERLAQSELGDRIKIRALPLYTTLDQSRQDEALKEREQPHDILSKRIVKHLEEVVAGDKAFGDVLAILNNAGQIHNLCTNLQKKLKSEKSLESLTGRVSFIPWFSPATAKQLFENDGDPRRELAIPRAESGTMRVVISTNRHRKALPEQPPTVIELEHKEQRVVVSTNVAETSLTIHGILHVVDSGLINQNKWDPATQTSGVSPILQSRAGCKQRWGRAGRLQAGDAWLLYSAEQFGEDDNTPPEKRKYADDKRTFVYYSQPEISRSPLELVLLTAKKSGVESLDPTHFPWLDAPDPGELARSDRSLRQKGALDPDGDLTTHGVELGGMIGIDPRVGNTLVVADRFSCAVEMATVIAVATAERKGLKAFLEFSKDWDDQSSQEVRRRQAVVFSGCQDDLDAALRLVACWEEVLAAGRAFTGMVRLIAEGDELTKELGAVSAGSVASKALKQLINANEELELESALKQLSKVHPNPKDRIPELRKAAEVSLTIRRDTARLAGAWQAVAHEWSFGAVWREAIVSHVLEKRPGRMLRDFMERMTDPKFASDPQAVADALGELRAADRKAAEDALARLPEAGARVWARANYLSPDALAGVVKSREELLEPLEAHKKGSEWRPLDLARNDRLRAILAHCLPENTFITTGNASYAPAAAGVPMAELDVEPAADSVCAKNPPGLFVCVERRAGPAVEGKPRKLFASFLVALPIEWVSALANTAQPFHKFSAIRLGKFVADRCPPQPHFGKDLLIDSIYPKSSLCQVKVIKSLGNGDCDVLVTLPHRRPEPVDLRPRRAGEGGVVERETEEAIRAPKVIAEDLSLTRQQRSIKAGVAVDEWDCAAVSALQWENLNRGDISNPITTVDPLQTIVIAEQVTRPMVKSDGVPGRLTAASRVFKPGERLVGEVTQILSPEHGACRLMLRAASSSGPVDRASRTIGPDDLGKLFTLTDLRLEVLPLDGGTLLVAREVNSGLEVTFGAKDLSFSWCGVVPERIFHALGGAAGRFQARLVQYDNFADFNKSPGHVRLRMTTHYVFDDLFPDPRELTGQQQAQVIQNDPSGTFVSLDRGAEGLSNAFMAVARIPEGQIQSEPNGTRHTIYASYSSHTTESWPEGVPLPDDTQFSNSPPGKLIHRGVVSSAQVDDWLTVAGERRDARAAIYSLYERSRQLNAMDETEYRRWSACIGKAVKGRVKRRPESGVGVEIGLSDAFGVKTWLPREEYSWYCDESVSQLKIGEELEVMGWEIDWEKNQLTLSRRRLTPNPYLQTNPGDRVRCEVTIRKPKGAELSISRLRGWAFAERLVWLPQEQNLESFEAVVTQVDREDGELRVSRWPLVQSLLRELAAHHALMGSVVEIKTNGVEVELARGIKAWLPGAEASWDRNVSLHQLFQKGSRIEVVLLPQTPDDREDNIRVSRKRVHSCEFIVSGAIGKFFGKGRATIDQFLPPGSAANEVVKGASPVRLLVGADSLAIFQQLVSNLARLAAAKGCSFRAASRPVGDAKELSTIPLPTRRIANEVVEPTSHVPSRMGLIARFIAFLRRLFGG